MNDYDSDPDRQPKSFYSIAIHYPLRLTRMEDGEWKASIYIYHSSTHSTQFSAFGKGYWEARNNLAKELAEQWEHLPKHRKPYEIRPFFGYCPEGK